MNRRHLRTVFAVTIVLAALWPLSAAERKDEPAPAGKPATTATTTSPAPAGDPFDYLVKYEYGQSREPLAAIEEQIRAATVEQHKAIEVKLLAALGSPGATADCKRFVCRMLQRMGSAQSIPALAALLGDEKLSHMARFALQGMGDPKVDEVLREAMGKAPAGNLKIGLISTIGTRGDRKAVPELAKCLTDADVGIAGAAVSALGQIGGTEAAKALAAARVADALQALKADAYVRCADKMLAEGQAAEAGAIYRELFAEGSAPVVRIAALRGIVKGEKEKAAPTVLAAMKDKDPQLQLAAGKFLNEMRGESVTQAMAVQLPSLSPGAQVVVLSALAERGDRTALPAVLEAMKGKDSSVCVAAIRAVGRLGDEAAVAVLVERAAQKGEEADATKAALVALSAPKVNETMIRQLQQAQGDAARTLIAVLADRQAAEAMPALFQAAENPDKAVRAEAVRALGLLAGEKDLPALVKALVKAEAADRSALESALSTAAARVPEADKRAGPILAEMPAAPVEAKASLLRALGRIGGAKALDAVRAAMNESDAKLKDAAVKALSDWPDAAAAEDLLSVARGGADPKHQILALQGYMRLASLETDSKVMMDMFQKASDLAKRPEEKRQVLSGLGNAKSVEALKVVMGYLDDESVNAEAGAAAINLAKALARTRAKEVAAAMKKVAETCRDKKTVDQAQGYLKTGKI